MNKKLDKLDYLILSELLLDAELSYVEIAKKVNSTPYTVRRRYEKMKKEGIFFRSTISIDLSKIGYQGKAQLFIKLSPNNKKSETIGYLKTVKNIIVITEIMGRYDILAIAPVTDLKSIQKLVGEARKAPFVERIEISLIDDVNFPICSSFGKVLSEKSRALANGIKSDFAR